MPELLTIVQAQSILPLSRAWFAKARCCGTGPEYVKIGSRIFYPCVALSWDGDNQGDTGAIRLTNASLGCAAPSVRRAGQPRRRPCGRELRPHPWPAMSSGIVR